MALHGGEIKYIISRPGYEGIKLFQTSSGMPPGEYTNEIFTRTQTDQAYSSDISNQAAAVSQPRTILKSRI